LALFHWKAESLILVLHLSVPLDAKAPASQGVSNKTMIEGRT
jgi:hypothetical protein